MNESRTTRNHADALLPLAVCFAIAHVAGGVAARLGHLSQASFLVFVVISIIVPVGGLFAVPSLSTRTRRIACAIVLTIPLLLPAFFLISMAYMITVAPKM